MADTKTGDGDITGGGDVKVPPGGSDSKHDDVAITIRQKKVGFNFSNDEDMDDYQYRPRPMAPKFIKGSKSQATRAILRQSTKYFKMDEANQRIHDMIKELDREQVKLHPSHAHEIGDPDEESDSEDSEEEQVQKERKEKERKVGSFQLQELEDEAEIEREVEVLRKQEDEKDAAAAAAGAAASPAGETGDEAKEGEAKQGDEEETQKIDEDKLKAETSVLWEALKCAARGKKILIQFLQTGVAPPIEVDAGVAKDPLLVNAELEVADTGYKGQGSAWWKNSGEDKDIGIKMLNECPLPSCRARMEDMLKTTTKARVEMLWRTGNTLFELKIGSRQKNLALAIACYEVLLDVCPSDHRSYKAIANSLTLAEVSLRLDYSTARAEAINVAENLANKREFETESNVLDEAAPQQRDAIELMDVMPDMSVLEHQNQTRHKADETGEFFQRSRTKLAKILEIDGPAENRAETSQAKTKRGKRGSKSKPSSKPKLELGKDKRKDKRKDKNKANDVTIDIGPAGDLEHNSVTDTSMSAFHLHPEVKRSKTPETGNRLESVGELPNPLTIGASERKFRPGDSKAGARSSAALLAVSSSSAAMGNVLGTSSADSGIIASAGDAKLAVSSDANAGTEGDALLGNRGGSIRPGLDESSPGVEGDALLGERQGGTFDGDIPV